ncbi:hypothetical protein [Chroococcidiopsis sp. CCMEE 29]|uniref:hypothetical protein n=1 Tax=Chroococcidiopsis sp. CCMEE 29 TaxID=155894 RepID=UPI0020213E8C|nr:hypothetical protein [Chroococcidiopsis sp. CCMEE 29]
MQTSDPTVTKLLEADSELAAQEAQLSAQLESVQQKRRSLTSVISLFTVEDTTTPTAAATAPATAAPNGKSEPTILEAARPELESALTTAIATAEPETQALEDTQPSRAKKPSSSFSTKQTNKPASVRKTAKKTESWQDYLRDEFSNSTLSEAVSEVLQRQPDQLLEIAAVVDAIFVEQIPKQVRTTARERVSNVLSDGVRKNKWYRGEAGSYSMSEAATQVDSAS